MLGIFDVRQRLYLYIYTHTYTLAEGSISPERANHGLLPLGISNLHQASPKPALGMGEGQGGWV